VSAIDRERFLRPGGAPRSQSPGAGLLRAPARYAAWHWRGELPLWVATVVSLSGLWLVQGALDQVVDCIDVTEHPRTVALLWFLEVAVLVLGALWWGRGLQQSALRHLERNGSVLLAFGAGAAGLCAMLWAAALWWDAARFAGQDAGRIVLGWSQPAQLRLESAGRVLVLEGEFEFGTKRRLRQTLDAHPGIEAVRLESPGGRAIEGLRVGELLRERGLDTLVSGHCASACATAFAGGRRRLITAEAKVGLHSAGGEGVSDESVARANRRAHDFMISRGIHVHVIEKGSAVPFDDIWYPEPWVLLASGLATDYANRPRI
jgi:hypothetical protein